MKKNIMNKNGFTFLEIVLSMALFGIIALALLLSIQYSMKTLFASGQFMKTNYEIQSEMENFIGTKTDINSTDKILEFIWENTTAVSNFTIQGKTVKKDSDSSFLKESFDGFTPINITP